VLTGRDPVGVRRAPGPVPKGATVSGMSEWPEGWHPVNAAEAKEYIDAHPGAEGDADLIEECESFLPITPRSS
jgi:hypothetical protein